MKEKDVLKAAEQELEGLGELSREKLMFLLALAKDVQEAWTPKNVSIEAEEMEKIKEIIRVFGSYIENHHYFDLLVSNKYGVIRACAEEGYSFFYDADSLFLRLIDEIYDDVRESGIIKEHMTIGIEPEEEPELLRRVQPYIDEMPDKGHYNELFEKFLQELREDRAD